MAADLDESPNEVVVAAPEAGFWRVGRTPNPLAFPPSSEPISAGSGNRWDSAAGEFSVLYLGTTLEVCFGETLARVRPKLPVLKIVQEEWRDLGFMDIGGLPADWRTRRQAARAEPLEADLPFLNVDSPEAVELIRHDLCDEIVELGYEDIDLSHIQGQDRQLTRLISAWAHHEGFGGIRYVSRLDHQWECWALFEGNPIRQVEVRPISKEMPELVKVARRYGLTVHGTH